MRPLRAAAVLLAGALLAAPSPGQVTPPAGVEVEELGDLAPPSDPVRRLESEAETAYGDGDLDRAIGLYRELLEQDLGPPERARVLLTVSWLELLQGRAEDAGRDLERSLYLAPDTSLRAELYNEEFARLFLDARSRALAARAADATERARAAVQAITAGNLVTARRLLGESLALQSDQPRALYNLAVVDLREGKTDDALAGFEKVVSLGEARPDGVPADLRALASAGAGLVYLTRGQDAEAAAALERAVALNPADGRAWNGLGVARGRLGDPASALAAYRRAFALRPDDEEVVDNLGRALIDAGNFGDAVEVLVAGSRKRPTSARLALTLGMAHRDAGDPDNARQAFERVLELDATNAARLADQAAVFLASLHLSAGRFAEAAREARRALAWNDGIADSWTCLGLAQKELGDLPGARESLERAFALAPDRAAAAYNLGTVLLAQRDLSAARQVFEQALVLDPGFGEARAILSRMEPAAGSLPAPAPTVARPTPLRPRPPLDARLAEANYPELGLRGLRVDAVDKGGIGERAGLQAGDLILKADGRPLVALQALVDYLASRPSRSTILLDLLRSGRPLRVSVVLD